MPSNKSTILTSVTALSLISCSFLFTLTRSIVDLQKDTFPVTVLFLDVFNLLNHEIKWIGRTFQYNV